MRFDSSEINKTKHKMRAKKIWNVEASKFATNTVNPIRNIMENVKLNPNPEKAMIALSIGDPTIFGNLKPAPETLKAVEEAVHANKFNGYAPSIGYKESREAVARYVSCPGAEVTFEDVILTSGCSHALEFCLTVLANPKQNILIPMPGFPLYQTLSQSIDIETKFYNLLPEKDWEVDLKHLESQIDQDTVGIVVINPSNPCGSVYSKEHLLAILDIAERHCLPIIADEIYGNFVFPGEEFHPMASLTTEVPILSCGGLTKRFLVPGWRMGWVIIYDKNDIFAKSVRSGLNKLSQKIVGSNTIVQGALPAILNNTPQSFFDETVKFVSDNATMAFRTLYSIPGLKPIMPKGAMYMMVKIEIAKFPNIKNDKDFVEKLVSEQSVFCLPGQCFDYPNYIRLVLTVPEEFLREACVRIGEFCSVHYQESIKRRLSKTLYFMNAVTQQNLIAVE